jgi:hypothetical protein
MSLTGSVGPFQGGSWQQYQDRLEQSFEANDVATAKRRAVLLSVFGQSTYDLLISLPLPTKPAAASYTAICRALKEHFEPKPRSVSRNLCRYAWRSIRKRRSRSFPSLFLHRLCTARHNCNSATRI